MRFVDEFRDPAMARALAREIAALCAPGRRYAFMEVCGGHTHTIYKHGIEDYLPPAIRLVHGPGCPVCVIPMGRVDDAMHIAAQPGVILTSSTWPARAAWWPSWTRPPRTSRSGRCGRTRAGSPRHGSAP
jgi:hydrogenase expression/formation protein HypD